MKSVTGSVMVCKTLLYISAQRGTSSPYIYFECCCASFKKNHVSLSDNDIIVEPDAHKGSRHSRGRYSVPVFKFHLFMTIPCLGYNY
jgi:hypothetical protein